MHVPGVGEDHMILYLLCIAILDYIEQPYKDQN